MEILGVSTTVAPYNGTERIHLRSFQGNLGRPFQWGWLLGWKKEERKEGQKYERKEGWSSRLVKVGETRRGTIVNDKSSKMAVPKNKTKQNKKKLIILSRHTEWHQNYWLLLLVVKHINERYVYKRNYLTDKFSKRIKLSNRKTDNHT